MCQDIRSATFPSGKPTAVLRVRAMKASHCVLYEVRLPDSAHRSTLTVAPSIRGNEKYCERKDLPFWLIENGVSSINDLRMAIYPPL